MYVVLRVCALFVCTARLSPGNLSWSCRDTVARIKAGGEWETTALLGVEDEGLPLCASMTVCACDIFLHFRNPLYTCIWWAGFDI